MAQPTGTVGSGIASQLVYMQEGTYGVVPGTFPGSGYTSLEFKSETLEVKKTNVQGQGLHAGGLYDRTARRVITNYSVQGAITMDLQTRKINLLLANMLGSVGSSLAALTQNASTKQYSAVHTPGPMNGNSLTFQKGVPSVSGVVEPFTEVGCKIVDWTINCQTGAIVELSMTIDGRNELAGSTGIVDPLNGSIPALANWQDTAGMDVFYFREAKLLQGTPTTAASSSSITGLPSTPPASTVNTVNTSGFLAAVTITGGTLTAVLVNGVQVGTTAGTYIVPVNGTVSITYSAAPTWAWFLATTSLGSTTPVANVKSVSVKHAIKLDSTRFFLGNQGYKSEQLENGYRSITGDVEVEWLSSEVFYNDFYADTPLSLQLSFVGYTNIGTSTQPEELDIIIPNVKLDAESPKVPGPQVVTQKSSFTVLDDEANVPIQFNYFTADSSNL